MAVWHQVLVIIIFKSVAKKFFFQNTASKNALTQKI